jgi:hypothetical protein
MPCAHDDGTLTQILNHENGLLEENDTEEGLIGLLR